VKKEYFYDLKLSLYTYNFTVEQNESKKHFYIRFVVWNIGQG